MRTLVTLLTALSITTPAVADSDTLLPITFASLQNDLEKALSKAAVRDPLSPLPCLEGGSEKSKVCRYALGDYMQIMAVAKKGSAEIVSVTMICASPQPSYSVKCLLADVAVMPLFAPDLSSETRGKIMKNLMSGVVVGTEASIRTEERKFILLKSSGLWFEVFAADVQN